MTGAMSSITPQAQEAIELARNGNHEAALATAKKALNTNPDDAGLQLFVGLLHSRLLQIAEALPHFRAAIANSPNDPVARRELITALIANDELEEAAALLDQGGLPAAAADRLRARLLASQGDPAAAAAIFQHLVEFDPGDFESWNYLGFCLLSIQRAGDAASAFHTSLTLRPEQTAIWEKWVDATIAAGFGESALTALQAQDEPHSALASARLLDRLDRPDEAIARMESFTQVNPDMVEGLSTLANMLERRNRLDDLARVIDRIKAVAPGFEGLPLLKAKHALRSKDFTQALRQAQAASPLADGGTRLQVIGEASDRLGDHRTAWDAYTAMNREDSRVNSMHREEAEDYLGRLDEQIAEMSESWSLQWSEASAPPASPIILLGFPRSGTTLLDTFLGAHPALCVSEEHPLWPVISNAAKPITNLPAMTERRTEELRALYWSTAFKMVPERGTRRLVDKFPFALVATPYIHRLFPGTPILLVLRHPCDVVLSGFFTRFQPSGAAASFSNLDTTARLYDGMMRFFTKSRSCLPLNVHEVRYERMIGDVDGEMQTVARFLELPWVDAIVQNRAAARERGHIKTPSYAQVSEPLYSRSIERWRNYRAQLEPVLPILEPWVREFGYTL